MRGRKEGLAAGSVFPRPGPATQAFTASAWSISRPGPRKRGLFTGPRMRCGRRSRTRPGRQARLSVRRPCAQEGEPGLLLLENLGLPPERVRRAGRGPGQGGGVGRTLSSPRLASSALKMVTVPPAGKTRRCASLDSPHTCTCGRRRRPLRSPAAQRRGRHLPGAPSTSPETSIRTPGALPGADSVAGLQTARAAS